MIIRKINTNEIKRTQEFCALAFEYEMTDTDKTPQQIYEDTVNHPSTRQDLHWQSQWAAFEDDNRTMLSTFTSIPYRANFDGHSMLMMGIGGVATLPQYRRRGGVRSCFEKALPDMYDQGATFSYLYPFSTAYYRKFGYELGCQRDEYRLLLRSMPKVPVGGYCKLLESGVNLKEEIRQVYTAWQNKYNMMTIDEDIEYQWVDKANPFKDKVYTYLYNDDDHNPLGYVTFAIKIEDGSRNLDCTRFCFSSVKGFYGLLNLLISLASDHEYAILRLPTDIELGPLLPEWSFGNVLQKREQFGMVRVVNVQKALTMARMRGTGSIVLDITDEQIQQNNARFEVEFFNDKATNVQSTEKPADLSMKIQDFSSLIVGRYGSSSLHYLQNVTINCTLDKASQIFYRKPLYISRYF